MLINIFIGNEKHCLACQSNWKSITFCCFINVSSAILGGFLVHSITKLFNNPLIQICTPIIYGCYSVYLWYSPISVSFNLILSQYINTNTKLLKIWTSNFDGTTNPDEICRHDINFVRKQLAHGFEIVDLMNISQCTFGKIVFVEFIESYSNLMFCIFFASSSMYQIFDASIRPENKVNIEKKPKICTF